MQKEELEYQILNFLSRTYNKNSFVEFLQHRAKNDIRNVLKEYLARENTNVWNKNIVPQFVAQNTALQDHLKEYQDNEPMISHYRAPSIGKILTDTSYHMPDINLRRTGWSKYEKPRE